MNIPQLDTRQDVADFLGVSWPSLRHTLYRTPSGSLYRAFVVRKRAGGERQIEAPTIRLKEIQTSLLRRLEQIYVPRAGVHGFTLERGIVSNACQHAKAKWVLNVDVKNFFPSIHVGRVVGLFKAWPFNASDEAAKVLAKLTTHDGRLPQGAPTSPIISNMICYKMDRELLELAKRCRCVYTRYADDISISSRLHRVPDEIIENVGGLFLPSTGLLAIFSEAGFALNKEKIRFQRATDRMVVTGLKVNRFPNVRKSLISQIRAMIHAWKKFGVEAAQEVFLLKYDRRVRNPQSMLPSFKYVLLGKLLFLRQVRGAEDSRFKAFARQIYELDPLLLPKSSTYDVQHMAIAATCVIADDDETQTGTGFFLAGVGLVTCAHVAEFATRVFYPDEIEKSFALNVVAIDKDLDLAICNTELVPRYELKANQDEISDNVGVFLHGFPQYNLGFQGQFQRGNVSGRRMRWGHVRYIVTMRIVAGNSGGPLLNSRGEAVGVAVTGDTPQEQGYDPSDWGVVPIRYIHLVKPVLGSGEHRIGEADASGSSD